MFCCLPLGLAGILENNIEQYRTMAKTQTLSRSLKWEAAIGGQETSGDVDIIYTDTDT
jgi:hypothetical protein